jgi:hypothetical protein
MGAAGEVERSETHLFYHRCLMGRYRSTHPTSGLFAM